MPVAEVVAGQFRQPAFVVGPDGEARRAVGVEEMLADLEDQGLVPPNALGPDALLLIEEVVLRKYWGTWVGFWAAWARVDEPHVAGSMPADVVAGEQVTVDVVVESLAGASPDGAHLRSVQRAFIPPPSWSRDRAPVRPQP